MINKLFKISKYNLSLDGKMEQSISLWLPEDHNYKGQDYNFPELY